MNKQVKTESSLSRIMGLTEYRRLYQMDSIFDLWTNQLHHQYWSIWRGSPVVQQNSLASWLEAATPTPSTPFPRPKGFLPLYAWDRFLSAHPDQIFAALIRRGITAGFCIGVNRSIPLHPAPGNLPSMRSQLSLVNDVAFIQCSDSHIGDLE